MKKSAIIVYPRVGLNASRILKETNFLIDNNIVQNVIILSMFYDDKLPVVQKVDDNIVIYRIKTKTYFLPKNSIGDSIKFLEFMLRVIFKFGKDKPTYIIPHSLSVLPIGYIFKKLWGSMLIYNAHELETERKGLSGARKKISKSLERLFISSCDSVIVVSDCIANWYKKEYSEIMNKISVIRNIPEMNYYSPQDKSYLRERFQIPQNEMIFIYQGVISEGRGVSLILDVFSNGININKHIVFLGFGTMIENVMHASSLHPNIHFHEAVLPSEIKKVTSSADVGLSLIENTCLSYYYCLPNKLFEYISSGIPVVCSDFPEMEAMINRYNIGWGISLESSSLGSLINKISRSEIEGMGRNIEQAISENNWSMEKEKYYNVFK